MQIDSVHRINSDVLVIGAGGAGLRAAIEAVKHGRSSTLVSKSRIGYGNNTAISAGGIAATGFGDSRDSPEKHFEDTVIGGQYLANQRLVEVMVANCKRQIYDLISLGVKFKKKGPNFIVHLAAGHSYARTLVTNNDLGTGFTFPLRRFAESIGVHFIENTLITQLVVSDGKVLGAIGIDAKGQAIIFDARAVVIASGGCGQAFLRTNNAAATTGDGYVLLYEAGVPLQDMEFVQYYPSSLGISGSSIILYENFVVADGAPIKNRFGQDVVELYGLRDPLLMTRDRLARAVMREIIEGRDVNGFLNLDLSAIPSDKLERQRHLMPRSSTVPKIYPIAPTVHFFMGGTWIDEHCQTQIEGLYAAGEVCCGVHGANRLGSNALAEVFVFGTIAGESAAKKAAASKNCAMNEAQLGTEIEKLRQLKPSKGKEDLGDLRRSLKETLWYKAGIIRSGQSLTDALRQVKSLQGQVEHANVECPRDLWKSIELRNMLTVSEMVCRTALLRAETRGAHCRQDYPNEDNETWLRNIRITNRDGQMFLSTHEVDLIKLTPQQNL